MATDRILVHEKVAQDFMDMMKASLARAATDGSALPVVATMSSKTRLQRAITEAISEGASVVTGSGKQDEVPGASIVPTILKDVDTPSTIWNEESFGPLVAITSFSTDEQAVQIVNSSEYGLSASVFTTDLRKGFAIAKQIKSG
jgi:acyl-CoA reductase-like NAD-dependent aldehyde dehydrogenase